MSGTKFMYNKWWQRVGDVMTLWDLQKLNKIYELLIEDVSDDDFNSVSFYMKQLFGYCCYVFSEISTLLDGHIRSDVQRNGFFRDFVDTSKKGTYSVISNMYTNKPIVLQKCCKDFLGRHLSAKDKLEMEREADSLEQMIPLVRSFIHHSVYKAGKKKSGVLKRFGVTSSFLDGLSMRFAPDTTSELSLYDCKEAVAFVTKNDTLCMFESFSKGICSFAPGFEEAHKVIAATFLLEADMKLATLLQSNLEKEEKIAKDAREFAELSKKNKHGGKKNKSGVTLTVAEPPPQFIMNTAKKDIAPRSQNAKKILSEAIIARALKKQKSVDDGLEDDEFFEHGFDMVNDDVAPLVAVGEVVISDKDFISNETIVQNVTFHPSVSPMYGESPSNEAKKFYKENMVHGRRTTVDEEESNEDTNVLFDQEYDNVSNGDQNSEDGSDSDYSAGINHDSIVQKAAEITAFVKEVRQNKPSRTTKRTDRVGSPIKARKIRSRGMDKDLFKTMLVLVGERPSVEAMKVLQADFDTEKKLKHLKAGFKDFLTSHIQAEAFSEINFERKVVEFITDIHWAMERVEGEVFTVNWPAVLSNIGKDIIEAFKVSNKNILDNLNLKIKSRLDSAGNVRPDSHVLEAAEMEENKKSMQAFQRVYLQKLSNIILSVGFKLVDHWMKVHKMVSDMDSELPLAKKPRRLAFMEHVHKVSVGEHSCQSMFEDSKSRDLVLAEKELPPDQSSILFFVHSLPKTDPYMLALIEVTRHQVKDHVVDWDVDAEMRVLFHKKPLVPRKVKEVASPTGVADSAVLNKVEQNSPIPQTSSGLQLSLQPEPSSPPAVSVDFVNLASALPAAPHISAGPPGTSEFRPSSVDNFVVPKEDSLRKLLKRLLEFVLVGLTESDENLCIEIKNACYLMLDGVNQGLILLIDLLKLCLGYVDENTPESPASRECFELLKCSLFVPYDHGDPQNTIGNGYCLYVSTFQLKERMKSGYVMDVRDMKEFAEPLFEPPNSIEDSSLRDEFQEHLRSISSCLQCEAPNGERVKHLTKLDQVIARHLESPQSGIESELYGHLEWISELNFNVSVFSTVHFKADLEGRWAKLTASSRIPRNQDSTGTANSFAEIGRLFQEPPNFMAWMDPHFFTIHSPSHQDVQASFASLTERLVKRIQDRVKSFNAEAVLRVCLSLIEKEAIDVSAIDIVSAAIETIFSGLREDRRVPSCALVDFFKPSVSIASSTSQDLMTYYQQRATQQADKLLKYASTIKSLRAANKQYRTAEKERLSSMSQPSSADVNSSSSSSSGSGSIFLSDNNQSSPSINRLIHEGGKESPVLTSDDNEFE